MELAEIIATLRMLEAAFRANDDPHNWEFMREFEESLLIYSGELLDAAERAEKAEAKLANAVLQHDDPALLAAAEELPKVIAELAITQKRLTAAGANLSDTQATKRRAEAELADANQMFHAYLGGWIHREPYPMPADDWYWQSPAYVKDEATGSLKAVDGIPQMNKELRKAIKSAKKGDKTE